MAGIIYGTCEEGKTIHTGRGKCDYVPGKVVGLLLADKNALFPIDPVEFNTQLEENIATGKLIYVGPFSGDTPAGGDARTSTTPYGMVTPNGVNPISNEYLIEGGSACQYKELIGLNKGNYRMFKIHDDGMITGTVRTVNAVDYFVGYNGYTQVREVEATGTDATYMLYLGVYFTESYVQERADMHAFKLTADPVGLIGIKLQETNSVITIVEACGGTEIGTDYATDWLPAHFIQADGTAATTATVNPDTGAVTIAPTGDYRIVGANVLYTAGIVGFDGLAEYVTVTAA